MKRNLYCYEVAGTEQDYQSEQGLETRRLGKPNKGIGSAVDEKVKEAFGKGRHYVKFSVERL